MCCGLESWFIERVYLPSCSARTYLITETGIVGMLHNGHQLDGVVALLSDTGQDVLSEVVVSRYLCMTMV